MLSRYSVSPRPAVLLALCLISSLGWAGVKPTIDPNTPEGRLLQKVQSEGDASKRLLLLELFPELFPSSPSMEYVWSEIQMRYQQAGRLDKALSAGANVLVFNPDNLEAACLNWRVAADMKDATLTQVWMTQAGTVAERVLKNPNPEMSKATIDCGSSARQANEFEQYKAAVTTPKAADRVKLLEEFMKTHPQTQHAGDIEITLFLTYREMGDAARSLAAAEKLVSHNDSREDAMLLVAESYFKSGRDPNVVASLSKKAIDRLSIAPKPEGMTDADWARNKAAELTQANYMLGSVNFQAEKWEAADQAFRAALPNLTDPRFRADVLNSLGWANYKLKNVADAIRFYSECTNIPGPFQQTAAKTLNIITAEFRIK
jgi:tetratricopeptide (TPR) repeat protein